jgi:hypothetical protein
MGCSIFLSSVIGYITSFGDDDNEAVTSYICNSYLYHAKLALLAFCLGEMTDQMMGIESFHHQQKRYFQ